MVGIWLLHVIGLLWTQDFHEGIKDLRIKLPLLFLPVVLSGSGSLQAKQFKVLLWLFIAAVLAGSLISMAVLKGFIHTHVPMYCQVSDGSYYINDGTWIDNNTDYPDATRTFAVITTGDKDTVGLYKYMEDGSISDINGSVGHGDEAAETPAQ